MNRRIVFRSEASQDVEASLQYYSTVRNGLATLFLRRLNEVIDRLSARPESYGFVENPVRAARVRQFSYVVYYRFDVDRIEILAVVHSSRDPQTWQSRS